MSELSDFEKVEVANILKRLKAGKTLSASDRRALQRYEEAKKSKTSGERFRKSELAKELGVSRVTLDKYLNREGAPEVDRHMTYSLEEAAQFIAAQKTEESKVKGQAYWAAEKVRLQCEMLAETMARERGDWMLREEAAKTLRPLMAELADAMQARFVRELPSKYKGRDAVECAALNQAACDAIAARFRKGTAIIAQ